MVHKIAVFVLCVVGVNRFCEVFSDDFDNIKTFFIKGLTDIYIYIYIYSYIYIYMTRYKRFVKCTRTLISF